MEISFLQKKSQQELSRKIERKVSETQVLVRTVAEVKSHYLEALRKVATSNISLSAFEQIAEWIDLISKDGISLDYYRELHLHY